QRPALDAMHFGWGPLSRIFETADGWVCVVADHDDEWQALCRAVERPELLTDARFTEADGRHAHADALAVELEKVFADRSAVEWYARLDAAGVPCEVSDSDFVLRLFDDPEVREKGWVTSYEHAGVGHMDVFGLLVDFDDTPGVVQRPSPVP